MDKVKNLTGNKKTKGFRLQWVLSQATMMKRMKASGYAIFTFLTQNGLRRSAAWVEIDKLNK